MDSILELPAESYAYNLLAEHTLDSLDTQHIGEPVVLTCRESGAGRPVLLLPGLWSTSFAFRKLVQPLSREYRVILPDLYDPSRRVVLPSLNYRPEGLAPWIQKICEALHLEKPLVVAHGETGMAALLLALDQPALFGALLLVGTQVDLDPALHRKGVFLSRRRLRDWWAKRNFRDPFRAALKMLPYVNPTLASRQELRHLARLWTTLPRARLTAQVLGQTVHEDYRIAFWKTLLEFAAQGGRPAIPIKWIIGDRETHILPAHRDRLTQILPGMELIIAEHSSSDVHVERPEWLIELIRSLTTLVDA